MLDVTSNGSEHRAANVLGEIVTKSENEIFEAHRSVRPEALEP